jgi:hypothetical protein
VTAAFVYHACRAGMPSLPSSTMHQSLGETGEVDEIDITPTHMIVSIPNDQWV